MRAGYHIQGDGMKKRNVIGSAVRRLRLAAQLSVDELSVRLRQAGSRLRPKDIADIETGGRRVMDRDIPHFSQALGVQIEALFSASRRNR